MNASTTEPPQHQHNRITLSNDPESSTALQSAYGMPVSLNLGRKVFISHSGRDKDFVRRLCKDLCRSYHGIDVFFFDEETLPKGKAITMEANILEEARRSALGVLVLTEDFFMHTQNPMLEVDAFVAGKVDLLPLFLKMSVDEFKEEKRWDRWERQWEKWVAADDKQVIKKWRSHLKCVRMYNGLEYCKIAPAGRLDLYIDQVVKHVVRIIGPAIPMTGEDVYGKRRLCQMVDSMFKKCSWKRSSQGDCTPTHINASTSNLGLGGNNSLYEYDLVGIYGFPGLGKTTLCKCLYDFYFGELKGKVCYIDLGSASMSDLDRMEHVLSRLDGGNSEDIRNLKLESGQVKYLLMERLSSMTDPIFLAIDNILPHPESKEEALIYLRCKFSKGSKILITSRSEHSLRNLSSLLHQSCSFSAVIEYMPALEYKEAREIFEHEFPDLRNCQSSNEMANVEEDLKRDVDACVNNCTIFSGKRYHPLMLKSLAAYLKWDDLTPGLDWKERLAKLVLEGIVHEEDAWKRVFQVLDLTYGLLAKEEKKVFLDLAVCYRVTTHHSLMYCMNHYEWIKMLHLTHRFSEREIKRILLQLHNFCFIHVEEGRGITIQDLMVEFGKHKSDADSNEFFVLEGGEPCLDALPRSARHISIVRCMWKTLRTLDLRDVEGVTVLTLIDNPGLEEVLLSRTTSAHLRSIIVNVPACTALRCIVNEDWSSQSLKWLMVKGNFNFCSPPSQGSLMVPAARMDVGSMFLGGFRNLKFLSLENLLLPGDYVQSIVLTPCANLKWLKVENMRGLKFIRVPESSSCLEEVYISRVPHLEELALVIPANSRTSTDISWCECLRTVSVSTTPPIICPGHVPAKPESELSIYECPLVTSVDDLSQYTGMFHFSTGLPPYKGQLYRFWTERFVDIAKNAGIDSSRCKATVTKLKISGYNRARQLGGVMALCLEDAQHIGPLISAMFRAQPTYIKELRIRCQQAGDGCGCDQNAPNFGSFPILGNTTSHERDLQPEFHYRCPQVRDLASLAQWCSLRYLSLQGCTSVEVWPDFTAMTSLVKLDLRNTSLKAWPSGVLLLPHFKELDVRGCQQLPAQELMLPGITVGFCFDPRMSDWFSKSRLSVKALATLLTEMNNGTRASRQKLHNFNEKMLSFNQQSTSASGILTC